MRWAAGVMALLFAVALGLQHNDPDPALWMSLYAVAASVSAAVAAGKLPARAALVALAGFAGGALYLAPALRWLRVESFTGASAGSLYDERVREALGLLLVVAWSAALFRWLWRRAARPLTVPVVVAAALAAAGVPLAFYFDERSSEPRVLIQRLASPALLVRSDAGLVTTVFDGNSNVRALLRVPLTGGPPIRLASEAMGVPSVALDADRVYWTSYLAGTVSAVPLRGGQVTVLASGLLRPFGIGVDASSVYFSSRRQGGRSLIKVDKSGQRTTVLVEDQGGVHSLLVQGGIVYWTTEDGVAKVSTSGGAVTRLASGRSRPTALAVDGGFAYYAVPGAVERVSVQGGKVERLARIPSRIVALAADQDTVYAATGAPSGGVMQLPSKGGAVVPMLPLPAGATGLALGAESVFVTTDGASGQLLALPR